MSTAEHGKSHESGPAHAADQHLSKRRQELDKRLVKWGKWFGGGIIASVAGWGLSFAVPWVGVPLYVAGAAAETVGGVGAAGNLLKRLRKKNR